MNLSRSVQLAMFATFVFGGCEDRICECSLLVHHVQCSGGFWLWHPSLRD